MVAIGKVRSVVVFPAASAPFRPAPRHALVEPRLPPIAKQVRSFVPTPPPPQTIVRAWEHRTTTLGQYDVDARDPQRIFVRMKIHLIGPQASIDQVRAMEREIERVLGQPGFNVDIQFVDAPATDAVDVNLITEGFSDALHWRPERLGAAACAHEIGHLFGLPDRYDYREHCDNEEMDLATRLYWCLRGHLEAREAEGGLMGTDAYSADAELTADEIRQIAE